MKKSANNPVGIIKEFDKLGRLVIPKELRDQRQLPFGFVLREQAPDEDE